MGFLFKTVPHSAGTSQKVFCMTGLYHSSLAPRWSCRWQVVVLSGLAMLVILLPGCRLMPWQRTAPVVALPQLAGQATSWRGEVSCPGCHERWLTLTLFPDGLFRIRERFVGTEKGDEDFYDIGRWFLQDATHLVLRGRGVSPRHFLLLKDGNLRLLDASGEALNGIRDYVLARQPHADLLTGPLRLLGFYVPEGEGLFTECMTSQLLPISREPGVADLSAAYAELAQREHLRGPVLTELSGRYVVPQPSRVAGNRLLITHFDHFWPGESCNKGPMAPLQPLRETRWELLDLGGQPVQEPVMGARAHLVLRQDGRLAGATGCNTVQGSYQREEGRLTFGRIVVTRMGCPGVAQVQEQAMLALFHSTRQFRMVSNQLELSDGSGQVLARFIAREMR